MEGPGCTHNGERLRKSVVGRRVIGVAGGAAAQVASAIRGRVLIDAITLGKQLWMIFRALDGATPDETAVRCHFGMAGSLHCGNTLPPSLSKGRKQLTLLVRFEPATGNELQSAACELRVHDSTAVLGDAPSARESVRTAQEREVCSPFFDTDAALSAVTTAPPGWMVADVLLDQSRLPGVGNIIKNEALHRAATDPRQQMRTINRETLERIVQEVRAFSAAWSRGGRQPPCSVYNRTACADCGAPVSFCKLGDVGSPRPTFWCSAFCAGKAKGHEGSVAKPTSKRKRSDGGPSAAEAATPLHSNPWEAAAARPARPALVEASGAARAPTASDPAPTAVTKAALAPASALVNGVTATLASSQPRCMQHGTRQIVLRRVRKAGPNEGRLFYSCGAQGCSLFKWADEGFPHCGCPNAPLAGLRVSKTQQSGGRWFFGCRRDAKARCAHFAWAPPDVPQRFGGLLSPLT